LGAAPAIVLDEATIKIRFGTEIHPDQRDLDTRWAHLTGQFCTLTGTCRARVGAAGLTATAIKSGVSAEWPHPWSQAFPDSVLEAP
jgi:hypothetical protein